MADERAARLLLRFETSKADIDRVRQSFTSLERQFTTFKAETERTNTALNKYAAQIQQSAAASLGQSRAYTSLVTGATEMASATERAAQQQRGLNTALQESSVASREAVAEYRAFQRENRLQTFAVRSVSSVLPGGGGEIGQTATQLFDLLDTIPKLNLSFRTLKESIVSNIQTIGLGGVGFIGGLLALSFALQKGAESAAEYAAAAKAAFGDYRTVQDLIRTGTSEQIQAEIDKQRAVVESARAQQQTLQEFLNAFEAELNKSPLLRAAAEASGALGVFNVQLRTTREQLAAAQGEADSAESKLRQLEGALTDGQVAANDAAAAEAQLAEARVKARETIAQLSQQRANLEAESQERALDAAIDRGIRERRANEDLERALEKQRQDHQTRLAGIEATGLERIANLRDQGVKRLSQFDQQTSAIQERLAAQINSDNDRMRKINAEFMRGELAAVEKYRAEEAKRTRGYNKERVRLLEDLSNSLLQAQEANDVVAFIQAQRAGEERLKRQAEDAQDEDRERALRFEAERRESEQRRAERIAELQTEAAERQRAIADELAARQAARQEIETEIAASVDAERARIQEQQRAQQQAYDERLRLDAEERAIRAKRQQEDEALRDARERDALNKQINNINWRIQMEADAAKLIVDMGQNGARIIGEAHVAMANAVAQELSRTAQAARSGTIPTPGVLTWNERSNIQWNLPRNLGGAGTSRMFAFADGGIVDRPTLGMFGERPGYAEAFIPFRRSEGIEAALSRLGVGGSSVAFNAPISIGADMTRAEVEGALIGMATAILDGLSSARAAR